MIDEPAAGSRSTAGAGAPDLDPRVERTRAEVHAAVFGLLREGGLEAVTHAHVAERSAVSRATVYRHFPDRASLLLSTMHAMRPSIELPAPTGRLRADVRAIVGEIAGHLRQNQMLAEMMVLLGRVQDDPEFAIVREHVIPPEPNPLVTVIRTAQAAGELPDDRPDEILVAGLMGALMSLRLMFGHPLDDRSIDLLVDQWLDGVLTR